MIRGAAGERIVAAEDYFVGPAYDITRMTVLAPGELLTAIRLPATWSGAQFSFEKIRDRQRLGLCPASAWRPRSSAADGTDRSAPPGRQWRGGAAVAARRAVEDAVRGKARTTTTAELAGSIAIEGRAAAGA